MPPRPGMRPAAGPVRSATAPHPGADPRAAEKPPRISSRGLCRCRPTPRTKPTLRPARRPAPEAHVRVEGSGSLQPPALRTEDHQAVTIRAGAGGTRGAIARPWTPPRRDNLTRECRSRRGQDPCAREVITHATGNFPTVGVTARPNCRQPAIRTGPPRHAYFRQEFACRRAAAAEDPTPVILIGRGQPSQWMNSPSCSRTTLTFEPARVCHPLPAKVPPPVSVFCAPASPRGTDRIKAAISRTPSGLNHTTGAPFAPACGTARTTRTSRPTASAAVSSS